MGDIARKTLFNASLIGKQPTTYVFILEQYFFMKL